MMVILKKNTDNMKFKFYKSKRKAHFNEERKIYYLYYFGAKIAIVISILFMNILI